MIKRLKDKRNISATFSLDFNSSFPSISQHSNDSPNINTMPYNYDNRSKNIKSVEMETSGTTKFNEYNGGSKCFLKQISYGSNDVFTNFNPNNTNIQNVVNDSVHSDLNLVSNNLKKLKKEDTISLASVPRSLHNNFKNNSKNNFKNKSNTPNNISSSNIINTNNAIKKSKKKSLSRSSFRGIFQSLSISRKKNSALDEEFSNSANITNNNKHGKNKLERLGSFIKTRRPSLKSPISPLSSLKASKYNRGSSQSLKVFRKAPKYTSPYPITSPVNDENSKLNINTASVEALMTLPSINRQTAQNIICYRNTLGGFNNIYDIAPVSGVGANVFNKIRADIKTTDVCFQEKYDENQQINGNNKIEFRKNNDNNKHGTKNNVGENQKSENQRHNRTENDNTKNENLENINRIKSNVDGEGDEILEENSTSQCNANPSLGTLDNSVFKNIKNRTFVNSENKECKERRNKSNFDEKNNNVKNTLDINNKKDITNMIYNNSNGNVNTNSSVVQSFVTEATVSKPTQPDFNKKITKNYKIKGISTDQCSLNDNKNNTNIHKNSIENGNKKYEVNAKNNDGLLQNNSHLLRNKEVNYNIVTGPTNLVRSSLSYIENNGKRSSFKEGDGNGKKMNNVCNINNTNNINNNFGGFSVKNVFRKSKKIVKSTNNNKTNGYEEYNQNNTNKNNDIKNRNNDNNDNKNKNMNSDGDENAGCFSKKMFHLPDIVQQ